MLFLPLGELSLYKAFFSDRVYEVSLASPLYSAAGDPGDYGRRATDSMIR